MSKHDGELVRQVLAGDQAAYEQLVSSYQGRIFAFVASRIRNFSATEDVVQNAFVEAYVHLKSLKSPEKFPGWLRGIALNLSNKWLQQKRPTVPIDDTSTDVTTEVLDVAVALPDLPDEVLEASEMKEAVLTAVDTLPDIYRETVLLYYMEEMTYPEIAAFLDVPESTVTGRLQVARNRLRDELMPMVEETLQEKRSTPQLTRKVMAALPPLLYLAAPAQASLLAKLKGMAMLKMMGIIGAGVVGTGVYFGGISTLLDWEGNREVVGTPQVSLELEGGGQSSRSDIQTQLSDNHESISHSNAENLPIEKINFNLTTFADYTIGYAYRVPESQGNDSVHIDISMFDSEGKKLANLVDVSRRAQSSHQGVHYDPNLREGTYVFKLIANRDSSLSLTKELVIKWGEHQRIKIADGKMKGVYKVALEELFKEKLLTIQKLESMKPVLEEGHDGLIMVQDRLTKVNTKIRKFEEIHPNSSGVIRGLEETLDKILQAKNEASFNRFVLSGSNASISGPSASGEKEKKQDKLNFKMKSSPQDSLVKITYEIPKALYPDPVFVEITVFDMLGATAAQPVSKTHKPGSYTAFLSKRELSDGIYFVHLAADRSRQNAVIHKLNLVWTERK